MFVAIYWHRKSKRLTGGKGCNGFIHGFLYITKSNRKTQLGFIYQLDDFHTLPFRLPCISFQCPKTACGYLWCVLSHYSIGFSFIFYTNISTHEIKFLCSHVSLLQPGWGEGGARLIVALLFWDNYLMWVCTVYVLCVSVSFAFCLTIILTCHSFVLFCFV